VAETAAGAARHRNGKRIHGEAHRDDDHLYHAHSGDTPSDALVNPSTGWSIEHGPAQCIRRASGGHESTVTVGATMQKMTTHESPSAGDFESHEDQTPPSKVAYVKTSEMRAEDDHGTCLRPLGLCELGGACESCWYRPDHPRFKNK
jgi:hypothetical protein